MSCSAAITVAGCRCIFLTETATNVVRVVARCATTDGGKWVGLVSDLALRSHSRRTAHRLVGGVTARAEPHTPTHPVRLPCAPVVLRASARTVPRWGGLRARGEK
jgi:hypothetical protein